MEGVPDDAADHDEEQWAALRRLAEALTAGEEERYPAALRILRRDPPAPRGSGVGEAALGLDGGYLFVQGPPGAGKTYAGARAIVDLLEAGMRVGVTSTAHKVIHNMLTEVEDIAAGRGFAFRGLKKSSSDNLESEFDSAHGLIESVDDNGALSDAGVALSAGTAWHYCREDTATLDYLFIDEAGQVSLADALALATAARNVVLLGDPRLNVAISRARCLAVLVCSPRLLDIHAKSIEQMRLVNALCRFAEVAGEIHQTVSAK